MAETDEKITIPPTLKFSGIRCFRREQSISLPRFTVFIGENSTGKSSALAVIRAAYALLSGTLDYSFNQSPFELGAFSEIAHYHGGTGKRVKEFTLGLSADLSSIESRVTVQGKFTGRQNQPFLSEITFSSDDLLIQVHLSKEPLEVRYQVGTAAIIVRLPPPFKQENFTLRLLAFLLPKSDEMGLTEIVAESPNQSFRPEEAARLEQFLEQLVLSVYSATAVYPISPIRTRPQRTYDPVKESPSPEGDHVPMLLASLRQERPKRRADFYNELHQFGTNSGMYSEIEVRMFKGEGSPFQINVQVPGQRRKSNLIDVGYGTSQVLPILADLQSRDSGTIFLVQQPEVHLHPKAQSELASAMVGIAQRKEQSLVIETHSDYLVDRLRMLVREGAIKSEDLSIYFFQHDDADVSIEKIGIDVEGRIIGPPPGYRKFFLDEARRLLE